MDHNHDFAVVHGSRGYTGKYYFLKSKPFFPSKGIPTNEISVIYVIT